MIVVRGGGVEEGGETEMKIGGAEIDRRDCPSFSISEDVYQVRLGNGEGTRVAKKVEEEDCKRETYRNHQAATFAQDPHTL